LTNITDHRVSIIEPVLMVRATNLLSSGYSSKHSGPKVGVAFGLTLERGCGAMSEKSQPNEKHEPAVARWLR
jgi:hypothetical protein